jgi:hypothetical protein
MTTIISQGLNSPLLVVQGYGGAEVLQRPGCVHVDLAPLTMVAIAFQPVNLLAATVAPRFQVAIGIMKCADDD